MKIIHLKEPILIKRFDNESFMVEVKNIFTNDENLVKFLYYLNNYETEIEEKKEILTKIKKIYRINGDQEMVIKSYKLQQVDCLVGIINVE